MTVLVQLPCLVVLNKSTHLWDREARLLGLVACSALPPPRVRSVVHRRLAVQLVAALVPAVEPQRGEAAHARERDDDHGDQHQALDLRRIGVGGVAVGRRGVHGRARRRRRRRQRRGRRVGWVEWWVEGWW
jgi:hypothetical protein